MSKGMSYGLINYGYWCHQSPQISQKSEASQGTPQNTDPRQALKVSNIACQGKGDSSNALLNSIKDSGQRKRNTSQGPTAAKNNDQEQAELITNMRTIDQVPPGASIDTAAKYTTLVEDVPLGEDEESHDSMTSVTEEEVLGFILWMEKMRQLPDRDEEPRICHDSGVLLESATIEHETPTSKPPSDGVPDRVLKHINNNVGRKESRVVLVDKMPSEAPASTRQDFMKGVTCMENHDPLLEKINQRENLFISAKRILDQKK